MDFFHCNACFSQPGTPKNLRFFLTNCGHLFCNACVSNTNVPQCRVCKAGCKVISLSQDLPEDLKLYFSDMVKEMKNVLKIVAIQNKHCKIYMEEFAPKLESAYAETQKELTKMKGELVELKKHNQALVVENQVLKKTSQMSQIRNKSPLGMLSFNSSSNTKGCNVGRGSAFLTPSPSSASGFSGSIPRLGQDRNSFSTPDSIRKMCAQKLSQIKANDGFTTPRTSNSQPFVLASQPPSTSYGRSRTGSTNRSWSTGSGSSSRSTTTLRKSGSSFMTNLNKSSLF